MHIAMIQDDWWPVVGGGPVHVLNLSTALAEVGGHRVDIYTRALTEGGEKHDETETYADGKVTVFRRPPATDYYNPLGRASSLLSLVPWRRLGKYDVVHGHTFLPAVPTQLCRLLGDAPVVFTVHGTAIPSGVGLSSSKLVNGLERAVERIFLTGFDYDLVVSVNREHLRLLRDHHDSVTYVPNGIDVDRFDVDTETEPGRILYLGRLAREKRVSDLLDAVERLRTRGRDVELVVVGTGPEEDRLQRRIEGTDLASVVSFEGRVPDEAIPYYYASAELFVLPSVWEGHPLTLLESWAAGTAAVASDVEGVSEFVEHGETGYLVEPESPTALADAIGYALDHDAERREWAATARNLVRERYTWETCARETAEKYEEVIAGR